MNEKDMVLSLQEINDETEDTPVAAGLTVLTWTVTTALSTISNNCG